MEFSWFQQEQMQFVTSPPDSIAASSGGGYGNEDYGSMGYYGQNCNPVNSLAANDIRQVSWVPDSHGDFG